MDQNSYAQVTTGSIVGSIADNTGAVIPGASVTALNIQTGTEARTTTNESGTYEFLLLRPGTHVLSVESSGFQRLVRENVVVRTTEVTRVNLTLEVGMVTETVTVTAETPLLQSEQATLGHVVEERTITSIPLATRNFTQILGTSPGVVGSIMNADQRGTGSDSVSVNGARRGSNN
ncbi:MAG: carboxypeptidase-like regulatory domain-containing protein, partial [Bryobacterales bacterium]